VEFGARLGCSFGGRSYVHVENSQPSSWSETVSPKLYRILAHCIIGLGKGASRGPPDSPVSRPTTGPLAPFRRSSHGVRYRRRTAAIAKTSFWTRPTTWASIVKVMTRRALPLALSVLLQALPALATAEATSVEPHPVVNPGPFDGLVRHFVGSFAGMNLGFQLAAVAATSTMSSQDVDSQVHTYFRDHPNWGKAAYPFAILGVAGPVALFGGLHVVGRSKDSRETVGAAYAVLQATGLTLGYVTVLKFFTGRPAPRDDDVPSVAANEGKLSRTFRPGFYRGGVISGWPSGHVAVTTAALGALVAYYPDSLLLKLTMAAAVAGMMAGVSSFERGGFHWASDAVAGALMAFPIGMSTGKGMRALVSGKRAQASSAWFVTPSLRADTVGAMLGRGF
jgi:hypothetical protein